MNRKMSLLVISCEKFSDLWDGHVKLLEQNWPDRDMMTYIVTDAPTTKSYPGIHIISAGVDLEWTERLAYALKQVDAEYIFITLDDYFLIKKVDNKRILELITMMEQEGFDYVRLFKRPKKSTLNEVERHKRVFHVNIKETYSVNLYAGIWKKKFLESTLKKTKNIWQYEVSLFLRAQEYGAKCAVSFRNEFKILDVVRKGKLLHSAARFFKDNPGIYNGNREINSWEYEIKLSIQTFVGRHMPKWIRKRIKAFMVSRGHQYFRDQAE